jgi:hypothetical protein
MDTVLIEKNEDHEEPVPSAWRQTFAEMVDALREGNTQLRGIAHVEPVDKATADIIARQIEDYGGTIAPLPEQTWNTSVCQWQLTYWEVLVDLFTVEDGLSDLVLHVVVQKDGGDFIFRPHLVYVP